MRELLERCPVGGLILFNGRWPEAAETLQRLQQQSEHGLLVGADIERGAGQQVHGLTMFPHARAFDELGEQATASVAAAAAVTARETLAAGIHATYAPVADVNTNPKNPIIATRAYADTPARASELITAYIHSAEAAGMLTTAKHFPGHGDTQQDSHDALPVLDRPAAELRQQELPSFQAAIDAGVSMIMSAHVAYPSLDPSGRPATLSKTILDTMLRKELGFQGVVCSDSLLMAGVQQHYANEADMAVAAIDAGVDLLLDVADPELVVEGIAKAVEQGKLSEQRFEQAFDRVWRLKAKAMHNATAAAGLTEALSTEAQALATEIAHQAIYRSEAAEPIEKTKPTTAVLLKPFNLPTDPDEQPLANALRQQLDDVIYFEFGPEPTDADIESVLGSLEEDRHLLLTLIVKPAAWHAFGLTPAQEKLVDALLKKQPSDATTVASLGVKTILDAYPQITSRYCTFSDVAVSQEALAGLLVG